MNKAAIKNFAIWARNKLIAEITYKAGLLGITEKGIKNPQPQSTNDVQFFDIGTKEPYSITGVEIEQRRNLVEFIQRKEKQSDYMSAYKSVIEEVAYTWFNRLIAVRFMEVNDYLPSRIRVLSSESSSKIEPDLVTSPFDSDLDYGPYERDRIIQLKYDNQLDELFRMLFIKQCNALNAILPELFENTNDYTELLMNVSFTDKDGVVYRLVHDISEDDFNVEKEGQVEIIGWLYQYYNTELNELVYDGNMSKSRIPKELLSAATTIYTPDWAIRYMVENSLGRLWIEGHPDDTLKAGWKYFLEDADQVSEVHNKLNTIHEEYKIIKPEEIKLIDPCMGSGHILVYAFDVLMQIYESYGYNQREAAKSIVENNLYGLDIDNRAYQLAYFAVMMKARQYNRRVLNEELKCNLYAIQESNEINRAHLQYLGHGMDSQERNTALQQINYLLDTFNDAREYGSILNIVNLNWDQLHLFSNNAELAGQMTLDTVGLEETQKRINLLVNMASIMTSKYHVVVTNPPYLGDSRFSSKLYEYVKINYPDVKSDLSMVMFKKAISSLCNSNGFISFITTTSWLYQKSFESLREFVIQNTDFDSLLDFGTELFDGKVGHNPIVAWVTRKHFTGKAMTAIRLVDYCYSRRNEKEIEYFNTTNRYYSHQEYFSQIPGMPIAYWLSSAMKEVFSYKKTLNDVGQARQGLGTSDNNRFLRFWYEVDWYNISMGCQSCEETVVRSEKWFPYIKGGAFRRWYPNKEYIVNYQHDGYEIKNAVMTKYPYLKKPDFVVKNTSTYFKSGITWSDVSSGLFSSRFVEEGYIYADAGPMFFPTESKEYILAYMNSRVFQKCVDLICQGLHYSTGQIPKVPYKSIRDENVKKIIIQLSRQNIDISKLDWDSYEISWEFKKHPYITFKSDSNALAETANAWVKATEAWFLQMKTNEEELNRIFIETYGLQGEITPSIEDNEITIRKADLNRDIRSFLSYAVGCMLGRYSVDVESLAFAGGNWDDSRYSTFIPDEDNVIPITDEQYFEDDIVGLFCAFLKRVFGSDTLEDNLDFIAKVLGNKGNTAREVIRNYFLKDFYKDHCKVYQKRPIYWLFDSGKEDGFKALIYMHRYNEDTIGNVRIDYLHRMQRVYDSEIARMQDTIDNSNNAREVAAATKRKEKLTKQLKETKEYDEKIAHLAVARPPIDLDDGVKVNYDKVQTGTDGRKLDVLAKI
ncbi:BREX-1 system adenine-specific DNA-methyltransferase PglX [Paenibacillus elgii]|uniref:BREX-1 system adenine-specific DNA-methyltransferase PglX n=1 Tax=Paenibacillus elgii TaxID=189691 RepID=UPI000FD6A9F8|nr:BREX-1 system adenine-specific DNA-methyltransferase PglX [Paenibacillus elgii]NEN84701.1 BREX-1 system adenine-specific DNA-methyltransferase PglX [Paenibacillus elgii]